MTSSHVSMVGLNPVPATEVQMDAQGWELFSGAVANAWNRAATIDFTTGSKLTTTFIQQGAALAGELDNGSIRRVSAGLGQG